MPMRGWLYTRTSLRNAFSGMSEHDWNARIPEEFSNKRTSAHLARTPGTVKRRTSKINQSRKSPDDWVIEFNVPVVTMPRTWYTSAASRHTSDCDSVSVHWAGQNWEREIVTAIMHELAGWFTACLTQRFVFPKRVESPAVPRTRRDTFWQPRGNGIVNFPRPGD